MFMTERDEPAALFKPEYFCDPDTDELQIRLKLASRETVPPVLGGQIGIRDAVGTLEFRYSPPNNDCKLQHWTILLPHRNYPSSLTWSCMCCAC